MAEEVIKQRTRYLVVVEGQSEQSFVAWLQMLSKAQLHIHLDCIVLGGGGFKSMLSEALRLHKRRRQAMGEYRRILLIVDGDRAGQGDWSIEELRHRASHHGIVVCVQNPNHEGLLFRMMPAMQNEHCDAKSAKHKLKKLWPIYEKPMDARALHRRFSLDDLIRTADFDRDLKVLLKTLGFI